MAMENAETRGGTLEGLQESKDAPVGRYGKADQLCSGGDLRTAREPSMVAPDEIRTDTIL